MTVNWASPEWIILATLLGPVLAVQAQKYLEAIRERSNRKGFILHVLMATRAARLSGEHVQALNMIDLVFFGMRVFRVLKWRTNAEQRVLNCWKEYHDHLSTPSADGEAALATWNGRSNDLFTNLLFAIATERGYEFDRVQISKGGYSPMAHGDVEMESKLVRRMAIRVMGGELPLKIQVTAPPAAAQALPRG
jgi:hypothetical protein